MRNNRIHPCRQIPQHPGVSVLVDRQAGAGVQTGEVQHSQVDACCPDPAVQLLVQAGKALPPSRDLQLVEGLFHGGGAADLPLATDRNETEGFGSSGQGPRALEAPGGSSDYSHYCMRFTLARPCSSLATVHTYTAPTHWGQCLYCRPLQMDQALPQGTRKASCPYFAPPILRRSASR